MNTMTLHHINVLFKPTTQSYKSLYKSNAEIGTSGQGKPWGNESHVTLCSRGEHEICYPWLQRGT